MSDAVPPIRRNQGFAPDRDGRREDSAETPEPGQHKLAGPNLPVPTPASTDGPQSPRPAGTRAATSFAAQLLGQRGAKRGLKGGKPVLDDARAAYLEAEWSGPADRRIRPGRITKTEV